MKKVGSAIAAVAMMATLLAGCNSEVGGTSTPSTGSSGEETLKGTLVFSGSTSMTDVCTALSEAFKNQYPDVTVTLNGGGSGAAIPALEDGSAQIGNLSRAVKEEENPDGKYEAITIALDGIAVVVNKDNPVTDLTLEQFAQIFKKEVTNWSEFGGADATISVIGREEGSGTRDGFEDIVDVGDECQYDVQLNSTGAVVSRIMSDPNAIGYVSYSAVNDDIKALKVGGVEISDENIENKTYQLQRPFVHAYLNGTDNELVQAYLEFLQTDEAQNIFKEDKLIPQEFWK